MDHHTQIKAVVNLDRAKGLSDEDIVRNRGTPPSCYYCGSLAVPAKVCGGCKGVVYCSTQCQKNSWKIRAIQNTPPNYGKHKTECERISRSMQRASDRDAVAAYFPWCQIGDNGVFDFQTFLATRNLLGSIGYGYWAMSAVLSAHDSNDDFVTAGSRMAMGDMAFMEAVFQHTVKKSGFIHGYDMLSENALQADNYEKWHGLPEEHIPSFNPQKLPAVKAGQILSSWKEWYEWRGISNESPVALVMHPAMSIYFMLTNNLGLKPAPENAQHKKKLTFHLLALEYELNLLPTFAELAILLPGYELEFLLVGPSVHKVTQLAQEKYPDGPAATGKPVLNYTAPNECSSISLTLWDRHDTWARHIYDDDSVPKPDAMLALNAGIQEYFDSWGHTMEHIFALRIPFVFTDYMEWYLESTGKRLDNQYQAIYEKVPQDEDLWSYYYDEDQRGIYEKFMANKKQTPWWKITMNPFHRPGQREGTSMFKVPFLTNGYVFEMNCEDWVQGG